jgi:hypothetical protein
MATTPKAAAPGHHVAGQRRSRGRFGRHLLEMIAAMMAGMFAGAAIFLAIVGVTWDEALVRYPAQSLLVVAAGMTVPMMAWMRYRGHSWHNCAEMAAAMVVPVIPLLCLVWFGVTKSAPCGLYCAVTIVAMLGVMVYRRGEYGIQQRHPNAIAAAGHDDR